MQQIYCYWFAWVLLLVVSSVLDIGLGINGKLVHEEKHYPPFLFLIARLFEHYTFIELSGMKMLSYIK